MAEKTLKVTDRIRQMNYRVIVLDEVLDKLLARDFLRRRGTIDEILSVSSRISEAQSSLWREVYDEYPEVISKTASIKGEQITYYE